MRIAQERDGETVVLSLEGRLDREWAEQPAFGGAPGPVGASGPSSL